jgi:hypothetical protein
MYLDEGHEMNKKVLEYIRTVKKQGDAVLVASWNDVVKPYTNQGSHPEVVERVWDVIGSSLPEDCRCLVYGTPALVHPKTGIILIFCNGTSYCVRLTVQLIKIALSAGAKTYQKWTYSGDMDTQRELGPYWIFGFWNKSEIKWCRKVYKELEQV